MKEFDQVCMKEAQKIYGKEYEDLDDKQRAIISNLVKKKLDKQ